MGTTPLPLTTPTVGFNPTRPFNEDGERIDPLVSVPMAAAQKLAAAATAEPGPEPGGWRPGAWALRVWPPIPLQPLEERVERKLAHSLKLALAKTMAPAVRRRATRGASAGRWERARAQDPAVVATASRVSMLSLTMMGIPCSGPRSLFDLRSPSSARAAASASGLSPRTERYSGP